MKIYLEELKNGWVIKDDDYRPKLQAFCKPSKIQETIEKFVKELKEIIEAQEKLDQQFKLEQEAKEAKREEALLEAIRTGKTKIKR